MTKDEAIKVLKTYDVNFYEYTAEEIADAIDMAIEALRQESIKFYYVESLDDYWIGRRLDNFYYATWRGRIGFVWSHSKYLPWGEHIVDENTLWKEHTYPSEPKEIPFVEWIIGFTKKYFQQEPKRGKWILDEKVSKKHIEPIYVCSACKNYAAWGDTEKTPFCPNCGARMEGGEE